MTLPKLLQRCHGYDILRRISTNITRSTVRIISSVEISFFPTRILQFSYGLNSINHLNVQINHLHVHLVKLTQTPQPESQGIFMGIPDSFHHHFEEFPKRQLFKGCDGNLPKKSRPGRCWKYLLGPAHERSMVQARKNGC